MTTTISVQEIIAQLRQPISSLDELEALLAAPLRSLGIPVTTSRSLKLTSPPSTRQLVTLQATVLGYVFPAWEDQTKLAWHYFCPPDRGEALVLGALNILTVPPLSPSAVDLLDKFVATYSLDQLWVMLRQGMGVSNEIKWDEALRNWISIPVKVANARAGKVEGVLNSEDFMFQTCMASERIIRSVASESQFSEETTNKLVQTIIKLVQTGHFSDGLFFSAILPTCLTHLDNDYRRVWKQITQNLPGPVLHTFVGSLVGFLNHPPSDSGPSNWQSDANLTSYEVSNLLESFFGSTHEGPPEVWNVLLGGGRSWSPTIIKATVGWATRVKSGKSPERQIDFNKVLLEEIPKDGEIPQEEVHSDSGLSALLEQVLSRWTDPQHISRALLSEHRYLTSLLVLTLGVLLSYTPPTPAPEIPYDPLSFSPPPSRPSSPTLTSQPKLHPLVLRTSTSPTFIRSVGTYLSHRDESVRRCGMLVAELVSGGKLAFGGWDEDGAEAGEIGREKRGEWQTWAKALRAESKDVLGILMKEKEQVQTVPERVAKELPATTDEPSHADSPQADSDDEAPEPDSDDDSLVGYASPSPTSSRAPSPTPSELEDPTLRRRPIPRPVYLAELGALLVEAPKNVVEIQPAEGFGLGPKARRGMGITGGRGGGDGEDEKARVDLALEVGAELVRKKRGYGSELEENAINLAYLFMGLQDNFDLDQFEERRQAVLVALVACCPTKAAPTIIEQFFHHQYSTAQRFTMLNALALGARELAGLPIPPPPNDVSKRPRIDFPSKVLPGVAHLEYMQENDIPPPPANRIEGPSRQRIEGMKSQVSSLVNDLSGMAITRSRQETEDSIPQIVRQRALRVGPNPGRGIAPVDSDAPTKLGYLSTQTPVVPFAQVAAEYFVAPLINRFWAHLQTSMAHETYARNGTSLKAGVGTGMILSPLVMTHLLGTLAVLLHAARHAPPFLHVLAPDAAELALSVGTRPLSRTGDEEGTEAGVLAGALELALTVLDSALELDGGQVFALERTDLLLGIGQWASTAFEALDKGERAPGVGGKDEEKAVRIAAGLVLTSERIVSKWRRSMSLN
ncbi:telomere length regulation protein [Rhizoctonia solani AG-3 Rhs1AP]|uniref:Telomere length regulation protein n=1 Tax=Rhizoctonia solani AG-3 Rhs1AP TaxID=1086054 RepID=X8J2J9_9AGAM|nr:telomere length regulation protein [Rhizoctonia solani AG-3 Rhs1AP]